MSTEEVVVADVLVPRDIHHLQQRAERGSAEAHDSAHGSHMPHTTQSHSVTIACLQACTPLGTVTAPPSETLVA